MIPANRGAGFKSARYPLRGGVQKLWNRYVKSRGPKRDFEQNLNVLRGHAAQHTMSDGASLKLFQELTSQVIQHGWIQLVPYQRGNLLAQAGTDFFGVLARSQVGSPTVSGDNHALDRVACVDVKFGILGPGKEGTEAQESGPSESHALPARTLGATGKSL